LIKRIIVISFLILIERYFSGSEVVEVLNIIVQSLFRVVPHRKDIHVVAQDAEVIVAILIFLEVDVIVPCIVLEVELDACDFLNLMYLQTDSPVLLKPSLPRGQKISL
jgi:hypothetical protein